MGVYVGDKRYAPYVGSTRRKAMAEKALPYDAEIEYLESTGTQWIDTGIVPDSIKNITMDMETLVLSMSGSTIYTIFGAGLLSSSSKYAFSQHYANITRFRHDYGNRTTNYSGILSGKHTITTSGRYIYIDGTQMAAGGVWSDVGYSLFLFACNEEGTANYLHASLKIYNFKVTQNSVDLIDLIPVRVGQVGYMYDKVSGQLFGNSGTGDFVLGNDKN